MRFSLTTTTFPLAVFAAVIPKAVVKSNGVAIKLTTTQTPFTNPDKSIDVDAADVHIASLSAKVLRSFDNYERNTGIAHPYAVNRSRIRNRGAGIPLMSDQKKSWYGELSIGTPPQTLSVEIDTGSSDMFVPWALCDDSCSGHRLWDAEESSTAENQAKAFSVTYMDGSKASGLLYVDNVTVAGFTADKQTIGAAMSYSTQFHKNNWAPDGLFGMAFESLSGYPAKPWFITLVEESKVVEPVFSIKLTSDGGELYIGGVNPELYQGEFTYSPVTVQAHWQVEIQSIQDDNRSMLLTNVPAVIDSDTTYIIGDPTRVSDMYHALGGTYVGKGFYSFQCDSFPAISFSFNGQALRIPLELLKLGKTSSGSNRCFSSIVAKDLGASFWMVGNVFLRGYYTTFDLGENGENPRVGFAQLRQ